jgi:hypothetical protein
MKTYIGPVTILFLVLANVLHAQVTIEGRIAEGKQFYAVRDYAHALQCFQLAAREDPKSAFAYLGIGNCDYILGQPRDALVAYQKYLSLNPENPAVSAMVQKLQDAAPSAPPPPAPGADHVHQGFYINFGGCFDLGYNHGLSGGGLVLGLGDTLDPNWSAQIEVDILIGDDVVYGTLGEDRYIPEIKWVPRPGGFEPYLIGGVGFVSEADNALALTPTQSTVYILPDLVLGGGLQTEGSVNLFVEAKLNVIFSSSGAETDFPVTGGFRADF